MVYSYEAEQKEGYVLLTASGTLETTDDLAALAESLQRFIDRFGCRRFLSDERAVVKNLAPHDFIVSCEQRLNEPRAWMRVAVLHSPEDVARLRWIETVLQNRSVAYRQFSSYEEAEQWLLS